jgi:hypothetical protein
MAVYALKPKWYMARPGRILPIEDPKIKKGFQVAITKIYNENEGRALRRQWMQFAGLNGPFNKPDTREDRNDLGQDDPIGWWTVNVDNASNIKHLAIHLLSQIASSSTTKRNRSTYSFFHSIERNRLASRRVKKLVAVHSALHLAHRKTPGYGRGPPKGKDVDLKDSAEIDEKDGPDELQHSLVGVPWLLVKVTLTLIVRLPLMVLITSCSKWM